MTDEEKMREAAKSYVRRTWKGGTRNADKLTNYSIQDFAAGWQAKDSEDRDEIKRLRESIDLITRGVENMSAVLESEHLSPALRREHQFAIEQLEALRDALLK